jgi:hypothetical protein
MTEAELVERWTAAANELALAFAYEPDANVEASLERMRKNLNDEFLRVFPHADPPTMAAGVDCIVVAIQKRRHELEAGGAMGRIVN